MRTAAGALLPSVTPYDTIARIRLGDRTFKMSSRRVKIFTNGPTPIDNTSGPRRFFQKILGALPFVRTDIQLVHNDIADYAMDEVVEVFSTERRTHRVRLRRRLPAYPGPGSPLKVEENGVFGAVSHLYTAYYEATIYSALLQILQTNTALAPAAALTPDGKTNNSFVKSVNYRVSQMPEYALWNIRPTVLHSTIAYFVQICVVRDKMTSMTTPLNDRPGNELMGRAHSYRSGAARLG